MATVRKLWVLGYVCTTAASNVVTWLYLRKYNTKMFYHLCVDCVTLGHVKLVQVIISNYFEFYMYTSKVNMLIEVKHFFFFSFFAFPIV